MKCKVHPIAEIFPMIPQDSGDFRDLVDSIRDDGLLEPIVLDGDLLIDGRNRLAACEQAKVDPRFVQWKDIAGKDTDVCEWIMSKNAIRRHLTDDQKLAVWDEFYRLVVKVYAAERQKQGQFKPGKSGNPTGKAKGQARTESCEPDRDHKSEHSNSTVGQIAQAAGTSFHKARQIVKLSKAAETDETARETLEKVKSGEVKLKDAVKALEPVQERSKRPLDELLEQRWAKFIKDIPVTDHTAVRLWVSAKLKEAAL